MCDLVSGPGAVDAFGHKAALSGTARYLADLIKAHLGCKTRAVELSVLQRCASPLASRTDVTEAYQVGGAAVEAAFRGETGKMCTIYRVSDIPYRTETGLTDVSRVANKEKCVPDEWISEDGMHVTPEFARYARPLIRGRAASILCRWCAASPASVKMSEQSARLSDVKEKVYGRYCSSQAYHFLRQSAGCRFSLFLSL